MWQIFVRISTWKCRYNNIYRLTTQLTRQIVVVQSDFDVRSSCQPSKDSIPRNLEDDNSKHISSKHAGFNVFRDASSRKTLYYILYSLYDRIACVFKLWNHTPVLKEQLIHLASYGQKSAGHYSGPRGR